MNRETAAVLNSKDILAASCELAGRIDSLVLSGGHWQPRFMILGQTKAGLLHQVGIAEPVRF